MVPGVVTAVTRLGQIFFGDPGIFTGLGFGGTAVGSKPTTVAPGEKTASGRSSMSMSMSLLMGSAVDACAGCFTIALVVA